jgi:iron complex transport system ATP-binding protein
MTALACQDLDVRIASTLVTTGLDCQFEAGAFWGLLGANGAGKTTLLRHLAGLDEAASGTVLLEDRGLSNWPRRSLAQRLGMLQQHIGYVFDASVLEVALTGRHPHIGPFGRESAGDVERARTALASVDLGALAARSVTTLSGGEARRLAFAALLVQDPAVLLLDEPTNHLDFRHQVRLMRQIGDLVYSQGRAAIAALHDVNLAATYCSHVLMLFGEGEWLAGPAAELLDVARLERLYQCPINALETPEGMRFHPSFKASRN